MINQYTRDNFWKIFTHYAQNFVTTWSYIARAKIYETENRNREKWVYSLENLFSELGLIKDFLESCVKCLSRRGLFFASMNAVYFCCILAGALLGQFLYTPPTYVGEPVRVYEFLLGLDWPFMILGIFLSNLVLSSFVFVTLPGLVFFPLSAVAVAIRATFWGILLSQLPTLQFLATFPTLILEGEGYVLAAMTGANLGLSWLNPEWAYREEGLSRLESIKRAFRDCTRIYALVIVFLFLAAVIETATIHFLTTA